MNAVSAWHDGVVGVATLEDSDGRGRLTFWVSGDRTDVELWFVPQRTEGDDAPEARVELRFASTDEPLSRLHDELLAYLHRPLTELAGRPFVADCLFEAATESLSLRFGGFPEGAIGREGAGGSFLRVTVTARAGLELRLAVDLTTLDRFAAQLGDLRT